MGKTIQEWSKDHAEISVTTQTPSTLSVIMMLILKTSLEVFPYNIVQCEAKIKMKKRVILYMVPHAVALWEESS